jgi:ParB family chromosome partitioning protein
LKIKLAQIAPNPDQPRKLFDTGKLIELSRSIEKTNGLLQAIKVRRIGREQFELVAGERRWRACKLWRDRGGPDWIEASVQRMPKRQRDIEAIVENLQREDVTPMEEARAFKRLVDQGMTPDELAEKVGKQTWRVTDRLRLLNLAPEHIQLFEGGNLSAEAVYEISRLDRHEDQSRIVRMISRGQLKGYNAIRAAVLEILDGQAQTEIFADRPKPTKEQLQTVAGMEAKIQRIVEMVAAGFHDNEVVIAKKIAPDKAALMADKLDLIRKHCLEMSNQLRRAAAQGLLAVGAGV